MREEIGHNLKYFLLIFTLLDELIFKCSDITTRGLL